MRSLFSQQGYPYPMYSGFTAAFTPPATPTDLFLFEGGTAQKTYKLWRMWFSAVQTTAGINVFFIAKHTTGNSGGTAVATNKIAHNPDSPAAGATVQHYTANPTVGGQVLGLWAGHVECPALLTTGETGYTGVMVDFTSIIGGPIIVKFGSGVALTFNGAALPAGLSVIAGATWSEE